MGVDAAGADHIDPDALGREFARHGNAQCADATFAGAVGI